jgi:type II secretory pathway pseudopilin PulG
MAKRLVSVVESRIVLAISVVILLSTFASSWYQAQVAAAKKQAQAELRAQFDIRDYINVLSVTAEDAYAGDPVRMEVVRELLQDFTGFYEVHVRTADGGSLWCTTGRVDGEYRMKDVEGNPTQLPDPLYLSWWAYGGNCTQRIAAGLAPARYAIETCHGIYNVPGFDEPQKVCWPAVAVFETWEN